MTAVGARFTKLVELARAPSSEHRRDLLREVTDLFFDTADVRTSRETHLFDDVLRTVARDMQQGVLAELAERFADSPDAPVQLMHAGALQHRLGHREGVEREVVHELDGGVGASAR